MLSAPELYLPSAPELPLGPTYPGYNTREHPTCDYTCEYSPSEYPSTPRPANYPLSNPAATDPPCKRACDSYPSSFDQTMGHQASKQHRRHGLSPQSSQATDSSQLSPQSSNSHRGDRSLPSIVTVLNSRISKKPHSASHHNLASSPIDRGGFFLSPIVSNDSQFSASSATRDYTLVDPSVDLTTSENFSPLLSLPIEILYQIIEIVYYDESTNSISSNLEKFSKTIPVLSKPFNQLAIRFLYKYAIFNRPHSFDRFLSNIQNQPDIGQYVEFMDFQTFTSIGLGRTGRMNQEIQMVTSDTILQALQLCPNLIEFQASENIQDDMDARVLSRLFSDMPKIQAMDFCGASSRAFATAFDQMSVTVPTDPDSMEVDNASSHSTTSKALNHLFKISFHDCSNLPVRVFEKLLPHFCHLRRLDLTHTSITSTTLLTYLPESCRLTHLSLARCSKLTTKDLIQFLTKHPAVANESLQWLNLQIDSNVVSPLTDQYLLYTLNNLNAPDLRYLNLGGMPVNKSILGIIKNKFPNLESLSIPHSNVDMDDLLALLQDNTSLKFLDLTNCKGLDRRNLTTFLKASFESGLAALEFDYKTLYDLTGGEHIKVQPVQTDFSVSSTSYLPLVWKFYDNEGRRAWIYKIDSTDPSYDALITGKSGNVGRSSHVVYYDLETGAKIETKVAKPKFLIYASRKINCSIGYYNLNTTKKKRYHRGEIAESVWPVEFSQRGIYNYYSLNVK